MKNLCFLIFLVIWGCLPEMIEKEIPSKQDIVELKEDFIFIEDEYFEEELSFEDIALDLKEFEEIEVKCPGEKGCPCKGDADCNSKICIETIEGWECSTKCKSQKDCPEDQRCSKDLICVYPYPDLCKPCIEDKDCEIPYLETTVYCKDYGKDGKFCARECSVNPDCPQGYICLFIEGKNNFCLPSDGKCPCSEKFIKKGYKTTCFIQNEFGKCSGEKTCDGECDAKVPEKELCDELDNDCDGETDEGVLPECNDNIPCTEDKCTSGECLNEIMKDYCFTGNVCYLKESENPENKCEVCDPQKNNTGWTYIDEKECNADFDGCTIGDKCAGGNCVPGPMAVCSYLNDDCNKGVCISVGINSYKCEKEKIENKSCNDKNPCTYEDKCIDGLCKGTLYSCDDKITCTEDICKGDGKCDNNLLPESCFIDGVCFLNGDKNPSNECQICEAEKNQKGWTENTDGTPCISPSLCVPKCFGGQCVEFAKEELNGLDDDCDKLIDEDFDYDHDGVFNKVDTCPSVWNPDNDEKICEKLEEGYSQWREIKLFQSDTEDEKSKWRRTNEPIEIPLVNGILDDSVVAYYKLDNGKSIDYSENGNNGNVIGAVVAEGSFGDKNGAMGFDGKDDYVEITKPVITSSFKEVTIMAMIKISETGKEYAIYSQPRAINATSIGLFISSDSRASFASFIGNVDKECKGVSVLEKSKWYNIAGVWKENKFQVFINGRLENSIDVSGGINPVNISTIGKKSYTTPAGQEGFFYGSIDEVLIFDRGLTPIEIKAYYESKRPYFISITPSAQKDFDDIRITEASKNIAEHKIPFEIIGVSPHSDSDLENVAGYWRLDGSEKDYLIVKMYDVLVNGKISPQKGRFGDNNGSIYLDGNSEIHYIKEPSSFAEFTIEMWLYPENTISTLISCFHPIYNLKTSDNSYIQLCKKNNCETSSAILFSKKWQHIALVSKDGKTKLYVDGIYQFEFSFPLTFHDAFILSSSSDEPKLQTTKFKGRFDEIIMHNVAKSYDYIYKRSNPKIPMIRFFTHTEPFPNENETYDYMKYILYWGNAGAQSAVPVLIALDTKTKCKGLLSPCTGYAGWWRFNEGSGLIAIDDSTNKNNGILLPSNSPPRYVGEFENVALSFDGNSEYVEVQNVPVILDGSDFTIESVFNMNKISPSEYSRVVEREASDGGYSIAVYNSTKKAGFTLCDKNNITSCIWNWIWTEISLNQSVSIVGRMSKKEISLYKDNFLQEDKKVKTPDTTSSQPLRIGASSGKLMEFFSGFIDSVRLTNRALDVDEFLHYPMNGYTVND